MRHITKPRRRPMPLILRDGLLWVPMPDGTQRTATVDECAVEIERLRSALEWIVENVDADKAPLLVGRARFALRDE